MTSPLPDSPHRTRPDRRAAGASLRVATPRRAHADWQPPASRPDPIALIEAQDQYAGLWIFEDGAERVVSGQRLMQASSDPFLGATAMPDGRLLYVRQLKNARLAAIATELQSADLPAYATLCGRALGRAHARSADAAALAGYLGRGERFAGAIAEFAALYADQTERDWHVFDAAIDSGRLRAA